MNSPTNASEIKFSSTDWPQAIPREPQTTPNHTTNSGQIQDRFRTLPNDIIYIYIANHQFSLYFTMFVNIIHSYHIRDRVRQFRTIQDNSGQPPEMRIPPAPQFPFWTTPPGAKVPLCVLAPGKLRHANWLSAPEAQED